MKTYNSKLNIFWEKFKVKDNLRYEENKEKFLELTLIVWNLFGKEIVSDYIRVYNIF